MIIGLYSGAHSSKVVIGGILAIAIADSLSDALGIHIATESENRHSSLEIWEATISTMVFKFIFAATFVIPFLFLTLAQAIAACLVWGLSLLGAFSFYIAKKRNEKPWKVVTEHLAIAVLVIILTHWAGKWVSSLFC
jgi:VIT1/CCC1 family predicted Fe2+/Mn2+ transporter